MRAQIQQLPASVIAVGALIVAQAGWLVMWTSRGWFYQDDFLFLTRAHDSSLSWSYLTQHTGGHLTPGFWMFFWLIAHVVGLHYLPTVILRLVLQAIATLLLYRVVRELSGSNRRSLAIVVVYCASPLLVPGSLYLTQSMSLLPAQVFSLVALLAVVRHSKTGSLRSSLAAGVALLLTAACWEKTGIDTTLVVILLVLGWLTPGGPRARFRAVLRDWKGWLLTLAPVVAFGALYLAKGYGSSANGHVATQSELHLAWIQWSHDVCLALIGGPWHWGFGPDVYTAFGTPTNGEIAAGQVAFGLFTVLVVWLYGWRRILAWLLPVVPVVVGIAVVAAGRYVYFGQIIALDYHYAFDLAVPVALALALAGRTGERRPTAHEPARQPRPGSVGRLLPAVGVLVIAGVVAASVVSARAWTKPWHRSPAKGYVTTLIAQAEQPGQPPALYNTFVSPTVLPRPDTPLPLSALFRLAGLDAHFDGGATGLQIVDDRGHIVPATFVTSSTGAATAKPVCPTLISGVQSVTLRFAPAVTPNYYFLRLQYFENTVSNVNVTVKTATGASLAVENGDRVQLGQSIGQQMFPLAFGAPASVTIAGTTAATNVCASEVTVGLPVAGTS